MHFKSVQVKNQEQNKKLFKRKLIMNIKAALKQKKNKNNVKICMSKVHKMAQ